MHYASNITNQSTFTDYFDENIKFSQYNRL